MKEKLIELFKVADELNSEMIFIGIQAVDSEEVIVIPNKYFKTKLEFYKGAYNEDLVHVMNDKVKIISFSHGGKEELSNHI